MSNRILPRHRPHRMAAPTERPSALEIFCARAEARAAQWAAGELGLHDAVDECQRVAEAYGLLIELGQDQVQAIMAAAFAAGQAPAPQLEPRLVEAEAPDNQDTFARACREADEKARRKPADPRIERARRLLADNVSLERAWAEVSRPAGVAVSTLRAAKFLLQQKDPARMRQWLNRHSAPERETILQYLERRKRTRAT